MPAMRDPLTVRPQPLSPRPRPSSAAGQPTLAEKIAQRLPLAMLGLAVVPLVSSILMRFIGAPVVLSILFLASLPSVFLIPILVLWQMGFLIYLYLQEDPLLDQKLVAWHLLSLAFGVAVWMYGMPLT
jgi:hypothetical protein